MKYRQENGTLRQTFVDYSENLIRDTIENTDKRNNKREEKREITCFHVDALQHKA